MQRENEFKDVKIGDVLLAGRNYDERIVVVERLTATQIICANDIRYSRNTGKRMGSTGWNASYIRVPTPEQLEEARLKVKIRNLQAFIDRIQVTKDNVSLVEELYKAITKATGETK